jgi:predicted NAD/FAD-dependent oxidoreductase
MIPIVIIGAGIAGLACARRLAEAGLAPVLLDKGRGIGGRVATRRIGDMQFDHGAQYVTAKNAGFATLLDALAKAGALADWHDGRGRKHSVGTPGMSAIPKALGVGLDIRQGAQVTRLVPDGDGWELHTEGGMLRSRRVVVTVPAPQVAGLLGPDHPLVAALAPVQMAPCLTLMAAVTAPAPFVTRQDPDDPLAWIAQNSSKPGRPQTDATLWVAQAGEAFSHAHIEQDAKAIADAMLPLLCDRLGVAQDRVTQATAHRWRYARVTQALGLPFLRSPDASLHLGGDWCIGARVEAAWDSGTAIADDILARE